MKRLAYITSWIPLGVVVTLMSLTVYGSLQQSIRIGANNPQIQMSEDAAYKIVNGAPAASVIPKENVDVSASLAPYMIVYDDQGNILASSAVLDGKVPEIPPGVLGYAREHKADRVTWEPKPGVRSAAVIVRYVGDKPGFVLAARSLREVEVFENKILLDVAAGWAVTMAASLLAYFMFRFR